MYDRLALQQKIYQYQEISPMVYDSHNSVN